MIEILMSIAETYLRFLMIGVSAYLIGHHVATADQTDKLTNELTRHISYALPIILSCIWGAMRNIWNRRAQLTAMLPWIKTENQLKAQLATGITPTIRTPPNTTPGVKES